MAEGRLSILDGLRGLAALSVVICHYYFLAAANPELLASKEWLPGRPFLDFFYYHGFRAVELFWVISGFIFTHIYCLGRRATTREFAVNRLARLYPLHLVTLGVMAVLQAAALASFGRYLFNPYNDLYHFFLNLFMVSAWGFSAGPSYNDVIWSVSVELVIYALFWVLRGWLVVRRAMGALILALLCGFVVMLGPPTFIFSCGFFYFFGAMLAFASTDLRQRRHGNAMLIAALAVAGALGLALRHPVISPSFGIACTAGALVLLAVHGEEMFGARARRAAQWLGDCTYGMYLWHMPLQLALIIGLSRFTDVAVLAANGWIMAFYLVLVLALARISYLVIERPARNRLRRLVRSAPVATVALAVR